MNIRSFLQPAIYFVVLTGLQWLVTRNLNLAGTAFCYNYIGAILLLPINLNPLGVLCLAFFTGLVTDTFYDTTGIHAFASVFTAWLRIWNLKLLTPAGGYDENTEVSIPALGIGWYILFMLPLLFFHCLIVFLLEYSSFSQFDITLLKALASALLSLFVIITVQFSVYSPQGLRK